MTLFARFATFLALVPALLAPLAGCDPQRIAELEEGVSTEADVTKRFGPPEQVWDSPNGARIFEYSRQPEGRKNYLITIGTDGRMTALRQVLTPANFAKVTPGLPMETVRKMLGKPAKVTPYPQKQETHYDWKYADGPNASDNKVFTVVFDRDLHVVGTGSVLDVPL